MYRGRGGCLLKFLRLIHCRPGVLIWKVEYMLVQNMPPNFFGFCRKAKSCLSNVWLVLETSDQKKIGSALTLTILHCELWELF